jgi:hypothetical protein
MAKDIRIKIIGDSKDFEAALGRAGKAGQTFGQKVQKGARIAGLALAGGLAIAAKVGFDELAEGQKVAAQTNAVLKSTGGVANVTAKQVDELASSLSKKSGIDDEAIASGENLLLTFKNIHNEAGKGNDIFNQATTAALDLSVALGKDMASSSIMVGKALNDPIKGITALGRAGIQFSDKQKKMIKRLVETGDVAGAQKIILKELQDEVGGSAEAYGDTLPGQIGKAREAFANMTGSIMLMFLPAMTAVAEGAQKVAAYLSEHPRLAKALAIGLGALAVALMAASVASTLLNLSLLANPVGLIVVGIIALGVALVVAYKKFETFRKVVDTVINFVKDHWKILLVVLTGGLAAAVILIATHWSTIKTKAKAVIDWTRNAWKTMTEALKSAFRTVVGSVKSIWESIKGAFVSAINWIVARLNSFIGKANSAIGKLNAIPGVNIPKVPTIGSVGGGSFSGDFSGEHGRAASSVNGRGATTYVFPNYVGDKRELVRAIQEADRTHRRGNGGSGVFA